mmetsp:Transcript_21309/g.32987  ORF Transcript_21309/g.32987 Transcript_21309/m.32987 type:complete len:127 (+) Transcript_21309:214-594(+)
MAALGKPTKARSASRGGLTSTQPKHMRSKNASATNIDLNNSGSYTIQNTNLGIFSKKIGKDGTSMASTQQQPLPPRPKRKTARDMVLDEMIEYHKKPNARLLNQLKDKCALSNIKFDPLFSKAKEL